MNDNLRAWRLRMELSQSECAVLYGISRRQWIRYEMGDTEVPAGVSHWMRLWEFHDRHVVEVRRPKRGHLGIISPNRRKEAS
jgi:predicted transcriptional regulator